MPTAEDYLECRHLGHAWDDIPVTRRPPWGVYIWLRCVRCTMERHDIIDSIKGDLRSRKYIPPPGYSYPKGQKPSIQELRLYQLKLSRKRRPHNRRRYAGA